MLKFFFWTVVLANAALFAYQRGYLDMWVPSGHEPARISNQLNPDNIKIVSAPPVASKPAPAQTAAAADAPAPAAAEAPATRAPAAAPTPAPVAVVTAPPAADKTAEKKKAAVIACTEIGNFSAEDAKRFSAQLATLSLGERVKQRTAREVTSHIVYIPPQADKEGAEQKAEELRQLGINDFFIIQDNSSLRWGISLGVFKTEEAARTHLANLTQKGVQAARIGERGVNSLVAFQVRDLEADKKAALEKIKSKFPKQEIRRCEPA